MPRPKYAVFIGRFQPLHRAHHEILKHSLERYDRVILGVGSARQARSPRNPFTAQERIEMIERTLSAEDRARVAFMPLRDYLYNDNQWIIDVQQKVAAIVEADEGPVSIVGRLKDRTSYYLRMFPQWPCDEYIAKHPEDATRVRREMFDGHWNAVAEVVPVAVYDWLRTWERTDDFRWVREEDQFIEHYKAQWESAPYAPTFVTTDAVLVQAGHVLVVRRRSAPGKGLYALPGGFLNPLETIESGMLRELKEETGIQVPKEVLKGSIVGERVFDHPDRSLRGRTITHGFCIHLRDGDLVAVKGGDDADKAFWMPLADLYEHEDRFFEDHVHIIRYFTSRF